MFRDFPIPSLHPTAPIGHAAAWCVGEQGAALYWAMHDEMFANQAQWSQLPDPSEFLASAAEKVGADMAAYAECVESGRTQQLVQDGMAAADALGYNGTPTFLFTAPFTETTFMLEGAYPLSEFSAWIDALVRQEAPPAEEVVEQEPPELPYWANAEGLRPDPDRPGYTMAGDQYKGNPDAPLVVVEFSDFQCPACARHALETQPAIDEQFVDSGESHVGVQASAAAGAPTGSGGGGRTGVCC